MVSSTRRSALGSIALLLLAPALAQAPWPARPVRMVVPFPAGGPTDFFARALAPELQHALGQPCIVENGPGAGGSVSSADVARAPADGYTLLMGTVGTHAINPALYPRLAYDPAKDFAPISLVATVPNVLVMNPARAREYGIDSVQALIRHAREHPGKLNMASGGNGTSQHLAGELFKMMTGVYMVHFPFRGGAPAEMALMGETMDLMFDSLTTAMPLIKAGRLLPLAVTTSKRSDAVPELPTVEEAGGPALKGFEASAWFGLFAPAGTPSEVVNRLNLEVAKALGLPRLRERLLAQGAVPIGGTSSEFSTYIAQEMRKWARVVVISRAKAD